MASEQFTDDLTGDGRIDLSSDRVEVREFMERSFGDVLHVSVTGIGTITAVAVFFWGRRRDVSIVFRFDDASDRMRARAYAVALVRALDDAGLDAKPFVGGILSALAVLGAGADSIAVDLHDEVSP